ncbi:hypothetical protein K438DRAFT_1819897, partial [Mycena galopus ATCC 62051]
MAANPWVVFGVGLAGSSALSLSAPYVRSPIDRPLSLPLAAAPPFTPCAQDSRSLRTSHALIWEAIDLELDIISIFGRFT